MAEKLIPFNQLAKAAYNRPIRRAKVNKIKRDFHEDMVQPAIVSFRDGRYYIVDHQHQSQAIYELNGSDPNTLIRCDVRTGLTYEQEADLYYRLNTGSDSLSAVDLIVGQIEAKDPEAIEFRDVVESRDYVIGGYSNRSLKAVTAALKVFRRDSGKERLSEILSITSACWPENPSGVQAQLISGIDMFLKHHALEYRQERFIKAMSHVDPKEVVRESNNFYKKMDSKTYTTAYCTYTTLIDYYNKGLRNKLEAVIPSRQ